MLPNLLFGMFLIALSGTMALLHVRAARNAENANLDERNLSFARRQCRRRLQICLLLAIVGAAIASGILITTAVLAAGYWICVVLLVCWVGTLAIGDLLGSQAHLRTLQEEHAVEHEALKAELAKYLAEHGEGPSPDSCPPRETGV